MESSLSDPDKEKVLALFLHLKLSLHQKRKLRALFVFLYSCYRDVKEHGFASNLIC